MRVAKLCRWKVTQSALLLTVIMGCYQQVVPPPVARDMTPGCVEAAKNAPMLPPRQIHINDDYFRFEAAVAVSLEGGSEPWAGDRRLVNEWVLDSLWRADSALVEDLLAKVVADRHQYGAGMANKAAAQYARFSARPRAMISALQWGGLDPNRQAIGLHAVRPPLSKEEQRVVLAFACEAAWALNALKTDPQMKQAFELGEIQVDWPLQNDMVLGEAVRLLENDARQTALSLLRISGSVSRIPEYEELLR